MPSRLRPTAPVAADAVLVGDPGRALLLAQELIEQPKMSNHARGLWGYSGRTPAGDELTVQATGMGGPSAAVVVADLAKLGVRRAVRVGSCVGLGGAARPGELLLAAEAVAEGGSAASFGVEVGGTISPDSDLMERLSRVLGEDAREARVGSFDAIGAAAAPADPEIDAADLQTLAVLARGREVGVAAAALLIVGEVGLDGEPIADEEMEEAARRAGRAASAALASIGLV